MAHRQGTASEAPSCTRHLLKPTAVISRRRAPAICLSLAAPIERIEPRQGARVIERSKSRGARPGLYSTAAFSLEERAFKFIVIVERGVRTDLQKALAAAPRDHVTIANTQ